MNYTEFENKVKSMSAHDIIMAMVDGLRKPRTKIDMSTFGAIEEGVCYGCAATNAILHIMEASKEEVKDHIRTFPDYRLCPPFVTHFESAMDYLRRGRVDDYNYFTAKLGIAPITPFPGQKLPRLGNNYTEAQLKEYEKLARYQLTK